MKKIIYLVFCFVFFSCKKNGDITSSDQTIKDVVLSKKNYADLASMSKVEIKSLINYLNTSGETERKLIFTKIKNLHSEQQFLQKKAFTRTLKANMTSLAQDDPTVEELMAVEDYTGYDDPEGTILEVPSPWGLSAKAFWYNWTVAKQITGFYRVESKEKFDVIDDGSQLPVTGRYRIIAINHSSSYILGYAPGISWQETANTIYYDPPPPTGEGGYHAFLQTQGVLNALGYNRPVESHRFVNAGVIYQSLGMQYQP